MDAKMKVESTELNLIHDLLKINEEVAIAYRDAMKQIREKDLQSILQRVIECCESSISELKTLLIDSNELQQEGKHYTDWKGVSLTTAGDKKTISVFCANDVLAVMNSSFSALTKPDIDTPLREMLADQQARLSKLFFHIEQFHDAQ